MIRSLPRIEVGGKISDGKFIFVMVGVLLLQNQLLDRDDIYKLFSNLTICIYYILFYIENK